MFFLCPAKMSSFLYAGVRWFQAQVLLPRCGGFRLPGRLLKPCCNSLPLVKQGMDNLNGDYYASWVI